MGSLTVLIQQLRSLTETSTGLEHIAAEYTTLRGQCVFMKTDLGLTTVAGALTENIKKNRYKDILPYDQSRVPLTLKTSPTETDYINASFIKGATARQYIATQGPLSNTLVDFWRMVWEYDIKVLVMACRQVEMGKRKCECYWAPEGQTSSFGPFSVHNEGEVLSSNEEVVIRSLSLSFLEESRSLSQYQYTAWPDHDIPYETAGILNMMELVRNTQGSHTGPLLIHCSAGCGRTGVICALDYIQDLLVTKQIKEDFSIMKIVQELRQQRPSAVQTKEQYQFLYLAVIFMFEKAMMNPPNQHHQNNQLLYDAESLKNAEHKTITVSPPVAAKRTVSLSLERSCQPSPLARTSRSMMNDTYAVINKSKQPLPASTSPAYSPSPSPRAPPASHHYDNDSHGATGNLLYSTVKPRVRPISSACLDTPIYDIAAPTNSRLGEGSSSLGTNAGYELVPAERNTSTEDDYEYVSNPIKDTSSHCLTGNIGFNCRVKKPRGPRDPPSDWTRLER